VCLLHNYYICLIEDSDRFFRKTTYVPDNKFVGAYELILSLFYFVVGQSASHLESYDSRIYLSFGWLTEVVFAKTKSECIT
jgi:hypothetical protein